ncbi:FAD-dependent oxidoreductase [Flaviflexus equikiangi]|uniref:FAD-dependent oxidoreductase n=1 Tax=Flaviflexus equikiangi TaxID=2758573 RepID=UPI0021D0E8E3|nr:FAD-dependent oxidoreductase [Flaviflexus equikiangi]
MQEPAFLPYDQLYILEDLLITICGTGLAGLRVAAELREAGYDGPMRAIDREGVPPYDRPPLSKNLFGDYRRPLSADGLGHIAELCDEIVTGSVDSLDGSDVIVDGIRYASDTTVLALGADPRETHPGALHLRTREDAERLRAVTGPVTIIGGGWIGCELASSFAAAGRPVTLVEIAEHILPAIGPAHTAIESALNSMGVDIVSTMPQDPGTIIEATGAVPHTLGLDLTTDGWGRTSYPGVYAVGDCATIGIGPSGGHWNTALHQAARVAHAIMTNPADDPLPLVPDVFSTIAGLEILVIGHPVGTPVTIDDGSRTLWVTEDRLTGGVTVDRPADAVALRRNIGSRITLEAAADPRPLKKILREL